jgi:hypothetical protein
MAPLLVFRLWTSTEPDVIRQSRDSGDCCRHGNPKHFQSLLHSVVAKRGEIRTHRACALYSIPAFTASLVCGDLAGIGPAPP